MHLWDRGAGLVSRALLCKSRDPNVRHGPGQLETAEWFQVTACREPGLGGRRLRPYAPEMNSFVAGWREAMPALELGGARPGVLMD